MMKNLTLLLTWVFMSRLSYDMLQNPRDALVFLFMNALNDFTWTCVCMIDTALLLIKPNSAILLLMFRSNALPKWQKLPTLSCSKECEFFFSYVAKVIECVMEKYF